LLLDLAVPEPEPELAPEPEPEELDDPLAMMLEMGFLSSSVEWLEARVEEGRVK
jgi:hypothetical protein